MTDPKVVEVLVAERHRAERSPLNDLTPRELEVLSLVAEGRSNSAIAGELFLTKRAVEKHINAIFMKLNLRESADTSRRVKAALIYLAGRPRAASSSMLTCRLAALSSGRSSAVWSRRGQGLEKRWRRSLPGGPKKRAGRLSRGGWMPVCRWRR